MGSQVPSHMRSIRAISTVENIEVGTFHFTLGPKYDMNVYMTTLFGSEAYVESWVKQKARPNSQHKS